MYCHQHQLGIPYRLMAEVTGVRVKGRTRLDWMNGVKVALGSRGMTVKSAKK